MNPTSSVREVTKKCLRSNLLTQIDIFAAEIKLNVGGSTVSRTKWGGLVQIVVTFFCIYLTGITFFSDGLSLKSNITMVLQNKDLGNIGQTIFDDTDQAISFQGFDATTLEPIDTEGRLEFKIWEIRMDSAGQNTTRNLTLTKGNCQYGDFCLKKEGNQGVAIFGKHTVENFNQASSQVYDPTLTYGDNSKIYMEAWFCDVLTGGPTCQPPSSLYFKIKFIQRDIKKFGEHSISAREFLWVPLASNIVTTVSTLNFTRFSYETNNQFFGHIGNILPTTINGGGWNGDVTKQIIFPAFFYSWYGGTPSFAQAVQPMWILSSGVTEEYFQNFDDISLPLLFFFSVKETFYFLAVFLFVKRYNENSNYLKISDSLFTMQDHVMN